MPLPVSFVSKLIDLDLPKLPSVTGLPQSITAGSVEEFLYAIGWGWLLLISFTGWGRITAKLFRVQQLPAAIACVLGIGASIFLGGLLNMAHAIYAGVLFGLAGLGLVFYICLRGQGPASYRWKDFWKQASLWSRLLVATALLIFFLRVAGTVRMAQFNINDDSSAYLVFPHKMLSVHTFATDPFSERRVTSSLGGSYFLQSLMISATSLPHIAMADRALGLALLAGVLFDFGIAFKLSTFQISLLEFLVCLVPQETYNLTFIVLPVSLLLAMVWMIWEIVEQDALETFRYTVLAGVIGGAVISLKSTYLPIAGTLLFVPYLLLFGKRNPKLALRLALIAGFGALITVMAWMISMKMTSATYLFPIFGRGLDYSHLHLFRAVPKFVTLRSVVKIFLQGIALLFLACIQVLVGRKGKESRLSIGVLLASALAITAMNYEASADSIWRYNFPQFFAAVIVFYLATASIFIRNPASRRTSLGFYAGIASLLAMVFYYDIAGKRPEPFRELRAEIANYRQSLRSGLSAESISSLSLQAKYNEIEAAIPNASISLENVAYPFLFNYKSHKIFMMDMPGASAPLPGWPFGEPTPVLVQYLKRNSIRYVVYDYSFALLNGASVCRRLEGRYRISEWLAEQSWISILTDTQLGDLKTQYHSIYDDGQIAVIDLERPVRDTTIGHSAWPFHTSLDMVCGPIAQRFFSVYSVSSNSTKQASPE